MTKCFLFANHLVFGTFCPSCCLPLHVRCSLCCRRYRTSIGTEWERLWCIFFSVFLLLKSSNWFVFWHFSVDLPICCVFLDADIPSRLSFCLCYVLSILGNERLTIILLLCHPLYLVSLATKNCPLFLYCSLSLLLLSLSALKCNSQCSLSMWNLVFTHSQSHTNRRFSTYYYHLFSNLFAPIFSLIACIFLSLSLLLASFCSPYHLTHVQKNKNDYKYVYLVKAK